MFSLVWLKTQGCVQALHNFDGRYGRDGVRICSPVCMFLGFYVIPRFCVSQSRSSTVIPHSSGGAANHAVPQVQRYPGVPRFASYVPWHLCPPILCYPVGLIMFPSRPTYIPQYQCSPVSMFPKFYNIRLRDAESVIIYVVSSLLCRQCVCLSISLRFFIMIAWSVLMS